MQFTIDDVVVYLYNVGVVLSGAWAIQTFVSGDRLLLVAASGVLALAWTIYFWVSIAPRLHLVRGARPDEDDSRARDPEH